MSCESWGLLISFIGGLLMLPESFRLSKKNKEGYVVFETKMNEPMIGQLFVIGVGLITIGFLIQFIHSFLV